MLSNCFGIPFYQSKIDETLFDKQNFIKLISENYFLDKTRNNWDDMSKLHHEYADEKNEKFNVIDYTELTNIYSKKIHNFFSELKLNDNWEFKFEIANYTCMKEVGNWMKEHTHIPSHFTAIHYLKFNPKEHPPTYYRNPLALGSAMGFLYKKFLDVLDATKPENCWLNDGIYLDVNEDDFVISPAIVSHMVPPMIETSNDLRIIIAMNIRLLEKK
jgi:hypothetical protein